MSFPLPLLPSQASKPTAPLRSFDFVKALHSLADAWTLVGCLDASGQRVTCGANVIGFIMVIGASAGELDSSDVGVKEGLAWEMPKRMQATRWTQS